MSLSGECEEVSTGAVTSPVGNWDFDYCPRGLHRVKLAKEVDNDNFVQRGSPEVRIVGENSNRDKVAAAFEMWMREFFSASDKENKGAKVSLPCVDVCPTVFGGERGENQSFRQRAWETLYREVPYGRTVSYGELARMIGSAGASRAVGTAMGNNPVSLVVPCHRVITSAGAAGNYAKCTKNDVKVWLLRHEGAF